MPEIGFHPVCLLFPAMPADELQELADDIKTHGQEQDILAWDNQICDGRSRFEACKIAGVEPRIKFLDAEPSVEKLVSLNLKRRHLTTSQRAMLATSLLPHFEAQAAKRMAATQFKPKSETNGHTEAPILAPPSEPGKSAEKAAKAVNVGKSSVKKAKRVIDKSPELAARVVAGEITVTEAERELAEPAPWKPTKDKHGTPIPKHLESKFAHDESFRRVHDSLAEAGKLILELGRAKMIAANDVQFIRTSLGNVSTKVKKSRPYLVCQKCDGKACGKCNQRGYTTEPTN